MDYLKTIGINAKKAFEDLRAVKHKKIKKVLENYNQSLLKNTNKIIRENLKDVKNVKRKHLVDRLILNKKRIEGIRHSINEITQKYFKNRFDTNLKHYFFSAKAAKKGMIKNNGGSIINLSSICWIRGAPGFILYSSAKSAIFGLTRSLARELGKYNIRVNSVSPGSIATERQVKLWLKPKLKKEIKSLQSLNKQLMPKDVSNMVLYLASDASSGCTKQNFIVDAGIT